MTGVIPVGIAHTVVIHLKLIKYASDEVYLMSLDTYEMFDFGNMTIKCTGLTYIRKSECDTSAQRAK